MIYTLTLNPAIDKNTSTDQLIPEKKLRCDTFKIEAGGGGINVSEALAELGETSTAIYTAGGLNGKRLEKLITLSNIISIPVVIKQETRESINVNELKTGNQFRFITPGPSISSNEIALIEKEILKINKGDILILSGSLPLGISEEFIGELAMLTKKNEIKFIIDTSGPALKKAIECGVYLIKPNSNELSRLCNKEALNDFEIKAEALKLINSGKCEVIVVSMGPDGAYLITKEIQKKFSAPAVNKLTTVGAGDSMIAGLVYQLHKNKSLEEAVMMGIACGTAATINKHKTIFDKQDAMAFYESLRTNFAGNNSLLGHK